MSKDKTWWQPRVKHLEQAIAGKTEALNGVYRIISAREFMALKLATRCSVNMVISANKVNSIALL